MYIFRSLLEFLLKISSQNSIIYLVFIIFTLSVENLGYCVIESAVFGLFVSVQCFSDDFLCVFSGEIEESSSSKMQFKWFCVIECIFMAVLAFQAWAYTDDLQGT